MSKYITDNQQQYYNTIIRIYRTDRLAEQPRGLYPTDEQMQYVARFVGLLSRGTRIRAAAIG